jgi:hypothetical protein
MLMQSSTGILANGQPASGRRNNGTAKRFKPSDCRLLPEQETSVTDDTEIQWHQEQIAKNRALLEELEAGNTAGGDVFPETQSEIDRLKAQIAQSELIVAAYHKEHPEAP